MEKSGKSSGELVTPKHGGGKIRRGSKPGNTPGTGRPPDEFKRMCRELASSADVEKVVRLVLKNPKHPAFTGALRWATEHGYGRPAQPLDVTSGGKSLADLLKGTAG